jgi:4-amino-4-deoxy-L-arabinose transferase-like glycosyltransferase
MKKSKIILTLSVILIIASFFRLYNLKTLPPGLYPDEAMNGSNALEVIETGNQKVFYPENNGREGLFMNIQALSVRVFGVNEPWTLRLPSALFGILGILGIFLLTGELFRNNKNRWRIALLSSFLMAGSFWHIIFSRIGFRAIMAPTFLIFASYLLLLAFHNKNHLWKGLFLGIIGGIVYGLGFHSYISYRATPLILIIPVIFFLIDSIKNHSLKKFFSVSLAFLAGTVTAIYPLVYYFMTNPGDFLGRTSQISVFSSASPIKDLLLNSLKTILMFNFVGDGNWRHNFAGYPALSAVAGIFFIIGLFIAGKKIFKREGGSAMPSLFLFFWVAVSLLPVVISNEGIPHALRAIIAIPAVMIISAWGMEFLWEKLKDKFASHKNGHLLFRVSLGAIFAFLIVEPFIMYFVLWGNNPNVAGAFNANYVEIAREINALPREMEKYVLVTAGGGDVRGVPVPSQTVMFMTGSFTKKGQEEKNIHYLTSDEDLSNVPEGSAVFIVR